MEAKGSATDGHIGIRANKPASFPKCVDGIQVELSVPPWEMPGCFRLDGEPHRGNFWWWLALLSYVFSILALVPFMGAAIGTLSFIPCLLVHCMAKRDLAKMRTGLMDPRGQVVTTNAAHLARLGLWFSSAGISIWGGLWLLLLCLSLPFK